MFFFFYQIYIKMIFIILYMLSLLSYLSYNLSYIIQLNVKYNLCTVVQIKMLKYDNFLYMLNKIFS